MKKRTAFIGTILSLISFGQPLLIKTGIVLSTTGLILSVPENVYARDAYYFFKRAFKKGEKGDHYGAISDYTKAIEIDPNYANAYNNRAILYEDLGDSYGAISDLSNAIKINPKDAKAYYNRGFSKGTLKDYAGEISDYTK